MFPAVRKAITALSILRRRPAAEFLAILREQLRSESSAHGLRRDLAAPFTAPAAKIDIDVRPLRPADVPAMFDPHAPGRSAEEARELADRLLLVSHGIPTCYVATTLDGTPCYVQWLFSAGENDEIREYFGGLFPKLAAGEFLLENAYTLERFRGLGIMPAAMARIAQKAADGGGRWAITFVATDNIPSLKGCRRAGFAPYLLRRVRWRFLRRRVTFTPLPPDTGEAAGTWVRESPPTGAEPSSRNARVE